MPLQNRHKRGHLASSDLLQLPVQDVAPLGNRKHGPAALGQLLCPALRAALGHVAHQEAAAIPQGKRISSHAPAFQAVALPVDVLAGIQQALLHPSQLISREHPGEGMDAIAVKTGIGRALDPCPIGLVWFAFFLRQMALFCLTTQQLPAICNQFQISHHLR